MKLQSILMPLTEFDHAEKGDALYGKSRFILLVNVNFNLGVHIDLYVP